MHIEQLEIERFGGLQEVSLKDLGQGIEVIHGTNEIGKTSLLEFIRAVFFGFEGLFRRGVLDPKVPCSGRLIVVTGKGPRGKRERHRFIIERRHEGPGIASLTRESYEDDIVGLGGDEGDSITVEQLDGTRTDAQRIYLQDIVGDIDEATFTNVMAFGLDELHELRTLEPEGCGSRLYELANGLDRSRVARTICQIEEAVQRLAQGDGQKTPRQLLLEKRDALRKAEDEHQSEYYVGDLFIEHTKIRREITSLEKAVTRATATESLARDALPISQLRHAWQELSDELESLKKVALVHPDFDGWQRDMKKRKQVFRVVEKRLKERRRLARELANRDTKTAIWKKRVEIKSLLEDRSQVERLVADVARTEAHARLAARRFGEQIGLCGLTKVISVEDPQTIDVGMAVVLPEGLSLSFGPLRNRARNCKRASRAVASARKQVARARSELAKAERQLDETGRALSGSTLTAAIEAATEQSAAIRKRMSAGERMTELHRTITQLEQEMSKQLASQVMPLSWLLGLGSIFVVGAGMLLSGLLLPAVVTGPLAYVIAALGLAGTGVASVMTWTLDKSSGARLGETRRQHALAQKQHKDVAVQCETLDTIISKSPNQFSHFSTEINDSQPESTHSPQTTLERRAARADAEILRLEHMAAHEGVLRSHKARVSKSKEKLKLAFSRRKKSVARWQRSLEQRGLPSTLSPSEVWRIGTHRHELLTLDDDRRRLSDEARHKREELAAASRRIEAILVECELLPEGTSLDQLQQLDDLLNKQQQIHERHKTCTRKLERARIRHRQAIRQLKVCDRTLKARLERWDAETEEIFLAKTDRRPYFDELTEKARIAERTWHDGRSRFKDPRMLDTWIEQSPTISLKQRLSDAESVTQELRENLGAQRARLTEIEKEIQLAGKNNGPETMQYQSATVDAQIAAHDQRIRLLKCTRGLLERTRAEVARHHQPAALIEASHWLARLTEGRYIQITTAADEARLDVHDAAGVIWNPERLSRGTREQVFLALRLALVRDLHEQGITLPVVMDDALVNFDDQRAQAASRTLVEFMNDRNGDHQMLVLTCHAHVATLFRAAKATVRTLGPKQISADGSADDDALPQESW
tara:strand:- start:237 stop:3551 length:3315 start_codon:yes stop_codon:yes gene_type:complete